MTKRGKLLPPMLAACALTLIAGCGVDGKSDGASNPTTTVKTTETTSATTTEPDTPETTEPDETTTTEPDETTTTTKGTASTLPDGADAIFRDSLEQGFKTAGLDDTQAKCLADGYLEKFGTDVTASTDQNKMLDLFGECNINPSDLGGG